MLHTSKRDLFKSFLLSLKFLKGSPVGSGSLLSSRICVAELEPVSAPASSSSLVERALYVSPDGGPGSNASAGMASFKSKISLSVLQNWHLCTIRQQRVLMLQWIDQSWFIKVIPGSRRVTAASNLLLFRMFTSSPTVQLVVPQSASSSSVGLFPCAARPANLLQTVRKQSSGFETLYHCQLGFLTSHDVENIWSPHSASVWR